MLWFRAQQAKCDQEMSRSTDQLNRFLDFSLLKQASASALRNFPANRGRVDPGPRCVRGCLLRRLYHK
jgi:hypothetical protein